MKNWCKKRKEDNIAKIYKVGYDAGFEAGKREAIFERYSPNQIREILGLAAVKNKEE